MTGFMALVLGAALLAGCTGPTYSYSKAGSDVADFGQLRLCAGASDVVGRQWNSHDCRRQHRLQAGSHSLPDVYGSAGLDGRSVPMTQGQDSPVQ